MDEAFIKKVQPNSPEAEQSVIGAMIMDRDAIADVIDIVPMISIRSRTASYLKR